MMEPISLNCVRHQLPNEVYCLECKSYLCGECISDHATASHNPRYLHVMQYAPKCIVPKIDTRMEALKSSTSGDSTEAESKLLKQGLEEIVPRMKELTESHEKTLSLLRKIFSKLSAYAKRPVKENFFDNVVKGLNNDKSRLKKALSERKTEDTLKIAQKIDIESMLSSSKVDSAALIQELAKAVEMMEQYDPLREAVAAASAVAAKCRTLRMVQYENNWKCDRRYLSSKMNLSEDGLTFGNTATSGYPAIIGDLPFETGLYAFEVIPASLECSGKEGFGIIEISKYLAAHQRDSAAPTVYDDMIGFLYQDTVRNMTVVQAHNMQMGVKYYVKVNMLELTMTITGPGLKLQATLKPGVAYAPCFSCGCSSNLIQIRPLSEYDEPGSDA